MDAMIAEGRSFEIIMSGKETFIQTILEKALP
jgi:hypothetical protein